LNNGAWLATGVRVVNNSTLEADVDGVRVLVGYAGISLPEAGPFSAQAVEVIQSFLSESPLVLVRDRSEQDDSGRQVGYIFSGDHFLNLELLQQGLAQADLQGPDQACAALFQQAELDARAKKIGLWQPALAPTATFHPLVTVSPRLPEACVCSSRPSCADFQTHDEAQACFNACNDYNSRLDEDHDGVACEELP
jgi:micrococcal nuclease